MKPNESRLRSSATVVPSSWSVLLLMNATNAGTSGQGVTTHADHGANKQPDRKESATKKTRVALGAKLTTNRLSRTAKRTLMIMKLSGVPVFHKCSPI
jgi:hypothetical protein